MSKVLVLGTFDGVHKGHQALFRQAQAVGGQAYAVLFEPNPAVVLNKNVMQLTTSKERESRITMCGIGCLYIPFTKQLAAMQPQEYMQLLQNKFEPSAIVVGFNHRFGAGASGTAADVISAGNKYGCKSFIVPPETYNNQAISSTRIRACIAGGEIDEANAMLGYSYEISGEIVHGKHLGTQMGIPTVNTLPPVQKLLPKIGVYATYTVINGRAYPSVTNVGVKPTVEDNGSITIESYILGFDGQAYGQSSTVRFLKFIRNEQKFASKELLAKQAADDAAIALAFIKTLQYRNSHGLR